MGYEQVRVTDELSRSVRRAVDVSAGNHETLGDLVKAMAAERWVQEPENLLFTRAELVCCDVQPGHVLRPGRSDNDYRLARTLA